jgi:hypothetical protein
LLIINISNWKILTFIFPFPSVVEIAEKPLYRVTCGDIGTEPRDVEKYLHAVLYLGKIWDW